MPEYCRIALFALTLAAAAAEAPAERPWMNKSLSPDARADLIQAELTRDEALTLVSGYFGVWDARMPEQYRADMPNGAGYVPGIPRLGIPALKETDASLGVANGGHMRKDDTAVAMPATILSAATWNPALAYAGGAMIGEEARRKGFNVLLAGGINLMRDPRGGRSFEYAGEDPWLASVIVGESIRGIQSRGIISTIKHLALNDQETGRMSMSADMSEAAMRESDLLAFELAIERGNPGAVMCAYNRVGGVYACENDFLLNAVLKGDWGYKGFVMSDWGAVHSTVNAALNGLDQQSSRFSDSAPFFGPPLKEAVEAGQVPEARLADMVHRILRSMFAFGLFDRPIVEQPIDVEADLEVAQRTAEEGIVLLKNDGDLLPIRPLAKGYRRVVVIGGYADVGVMSGGGSSQVIPIGFKAMMEILNGGKNGNKYGEVPDERPDYPKSSIVFHPPAPLDEIGAEMKRLAPAAHRVLFYSGADIERAVRLAQTNDLVIVFAQQWMQEARDNSNITLGGRQDELIAKIAAANPRTVVVLQTGAPVRMPWIDKVPAVLQAWYSGNRGGAAIARILFGTVNPSGRLPVTFPLGKYQLPRPRIPGYGHKGSRHVEAHAKTPFDIDYVEGANVGYKWFALKKTPPLFPFGHGLSYTDFAYGHLRAQGGRTVRASFEMINTGNREGKAVGQVYVLPPGGVMRLVGFVKQTLMPGELKRVSIGADPRLLASFDAASRQWRIKAGEYLVMLGTSSTDIRAYQKVRIEESSIEP